MKIKCNRGKNKITIEINTDFKVGDKIFTPYNFVEETLASIEYRLKLSDCIDGLSCTIVYGDSYTEEHSQIYLPFGGYKNDKDARRYWFNDVNNFLFGRKEYNNLIIKYKDDESFLKEINFARDIQINKKIQEIKKQIIKNIETLNELKKMR